MLFDTHMHCDYSCDSHMEFADAVAVTQACSSRHDCYGTLGL